MNSNLRTILIVAAAVIIASGAFAYGALTAPKKVAPTPIPTPTLSKDQLTEKLKIEEETILGVLKTAYPTVATDYMINKGSLYGKGEWYGTTLTYRGSDSGNRDTLRVLMQKKSGVWILRTIPPRQLLSTVEFPDTPKSILRSINEPVSLPEGDDSPAISANE